ncbi:MAG: hypothetical protein EBU49_04300, partial [Proteobacteria bacterium]|nr:hypothetical protein [Pseudomonadota bacterium]
MKKISRAFLSLGFLASGGTALAAPWQLAPGLLSDTAIRNLQDRHPDITSPAELMQLLEDVGRKSDFLELDAKFVASGPDGSFLIGGRHAQVVGEVEVESSLRDLRSQLKIMAQNVEGQVDTPDMRAKVVSDFVLYLKSRGYFEAKVSVRPVQEESYVVYRAIVAEGEPCIIEKVDRGIKLPAGVSPGVAVGDICDQEAIRQSVDRLLEAMRARGYNQARIELAGLTRHPQRNSATVHIGGVLGKRIRYQVRDRSTTLRIDDLFAQDELS